jgi:glutamine amidotransferase
MRVVVIDSGMANIRSLTAALEYLGAPCVVSVDAADLESATHVILPGVGAFDGAMRNLGAHALTDALVDFGGRQGRPLLGVCLGMQLLSEGSEEGEQRGLGLVAGRCRRLRADPQGGRKVPHVGFSHVYGFSPDGLFKNLGSEADFYFTHSYALPAGDSEMNAGYCDHTQTFVAAFQRGNLCGAQFHPEKSQSTGLRLISNFLELASR